MPPQEPRRPMPKWARALVQSALVGLFVLLAFWAVYRFHSKLAMASLAASAFIAFGFPEAQSARTRFLFGGYLCGVICGAASRMLLQVLMPQRLAEDPRVLIAFCAGAVFLTAFTMIALDLQHPPAAALAVSMVLEPSPITMGLYMLGCVLLLCLLRRLMVKVLSRRYTQNI